MESFDFSNKTETKFVITQCKKEKSFKESTLDKLIATIPILLNLEQDESMLLNRFNSDLITQVLLLREVWQKTAINGGQVSIEFNYSCNASRIEVNNTFKEKQKQLIEIASDNISSSDISFNLYSSIELLEFYQKKKANRLSIAFKDRPLSIDYLDNGIGYIGTVKLSEYRLFLTSDSGDIRDELFESNIRHFQGMVDVNKKIKQTIENPKDEDFWWLNNGITIIAEDPKEVGKKLSIENVQIVNGLQTSYSIFNSNNVKTEDNRSVLVKVIINSNKEITDNIIASTNSQNPVSATLLRATEAIQRNLELFFLNAGYYYDRRKNYYKNQGKPATKIFSIQLTAQAIQSIAFDDPHTARSRPTSLLKTDTTYNKIFDAKLDFNLYLKCCLIYKKSHNFWLNFSDPMIKNKTANFKLHLSSIVSKVLFRKKVVSIPEVIGIEINDISNELLNECINLLKDSIDQYLLENSSTNLINIAKSREFTEYLLDKIEDKYLIRKSF